MEGEHLRAFVDTKKLKEELSKVCDLSDKELRDLIHRCLTMPEWAEGEDDDKD